ncbi:MAG: CocE/NonD family hydrolase [Clostridia bacterium]|nr:CocE/NonD family hydrolase [Clostridia bacterium]
MPYSCYHQYLTVPDGAALFTAICLPCGEGTFPSVIFRSPYVDAAQEMGEDEICAALADSHRDWLENGYAVIFQHCRGRGKSTGDCIPYIYEREDSLALYDWVRAQPFYNGELFLCGRSYTSSVHFVTAPFAPDIKGAVLEVQDCDRYNCNYRNGFYKMGLHGAWYVKMYKKKSILNKPFTREFYHMLPLIDFSQTVFGERAEDFDEILRHPRREDPFWQTRYGGGEARDAIKHADIPILLTTGFYDIYTGGIFDMWHALDGATKAKSALLVQPYDHSGKPNDQPLCFDRATLGEVFGPYPRLWCDAVRGKVDFPVPRGKVTYYQLFGDQYLTDDFRTPDRAVTFPLGTGERTYRYNPYAPATFHGGLSANFGGNVWQSPAKRHDVLSFHTPVFEQDMFVKGKMTAKLRVRSTAEDTCFYIRLSLCKEEGDYGLRDDIQQISNLCPDYVPGEELTLDFAFDEHAFVIRAGERLRIDVSSSAFPLYVRHTNRRGLYCEQTTAAVADNTVICDLSSITLPCEGATGGTSC